MSKASQCQKRHKPESEWSNLTNRYDEDTDKSKKKIHNKRFKKYFPIKNNFNNFEESFSHDSNQDVP